MKVKWSDPGPTLTDDMVRRFEASTGQHVPDDAVWFMRNVVNGGYPEQEQWVPLDEDYNWPGDVDALYGIGHDKPYLDCRDPVDFLAERGFHGFWPLASEGCGGMYVLRLEGPERGEVWHLPCDFWVEPDIEAAYFVSPTIRAFAKLVEEQREPLGWDEVGQQSL